jgi:TonB family protein
MTVLEVDSAAARYDDSAAPPYPQNLLDRRIEGTVAIQYIVDTTGFADTSSVVILAATHEDFAKSVRSTLPAMHFRPALMSHRKVRQLVQQLFSFKIDTAMIAQQTLKQAALGKKP